MPDLAAAASAFEAAIAQSEAELTELDGRCLVAQTAYEAELTRLRDLHWPEAGPSSPWTDHLTAEERNSLDDLCAAWQELHQQLHDARVVHRGALPRDPGPQHGNGGGRIVLHEDPEHGHAHITTAAEIAAGRATEPEEGEAQ